VLLEHLDPELQVFHEARRSAHAELRIVEFETDVDDGSDGKRHGVSSTNRCAGGTVCHSLRRHAESAAVNPGNPWPGNRGLPGQREFCGSSIVRRKSGHVAIVKDTC